MTTTPNSRTADSVVSIEKAFERDRVPHLWMHLANLMLGAWLLASTAMIDSGSTPLRWSAPCSLAILMLATADHHSQGV